MSVDAGYGIAIALAYLFVWAISLLFMRRGTNWARIVLAMFGGVLVRDAIVGIANASINATGGNSHGLVYILLGVAQFSVVGAAVAYMFKPDTNRYFLSPASS